MMPGSTMHVTVVRLDPNHHPWRLPREADLQCRLLNVPISYTPGQAGVPFSYTALPGRYLEALAEFAVPAQNAAPLLLLNPAYDLPAIVLEALLAELGDLEFGTLQESHASAIILTDLRQRVLAYALPSGVCKNSLDNLRFLSCFDPQLDASLLGQAGIRSVVRSLRLPNNTQLPEALPSFDGLELIARASTAARVRMLECGASKTYAISHHHAGDVLLALQAISRSTRRIDKFVVNQAYADIVREVSPQLPILEIESDVPRRGKLASLYHPLNDEALFLERVLLPALPVDASFIYLRPLRNYNSADWTLAAQMAFALGSRTDANVFPAASPLLAKDIQPAIATEASNPHFGYRILLHFDGGWPLKIYPEAWQHELIEALGQVGYQVSVLADGTGNFSVPQHSFTSLAGLNSLLGMHDLLIGMDSFPCHYAALHLAKPTLCLFGSTSIKNIAHAAPGYIAAHCGLECSPCSDSRVCRRYGGGECHNFLPPKNVVSLVRQCLEHH